MLPFVSASPFRIFASVTMQLLLHLSDTFTIVKLKIMMIHPSTPRLIGKGIISCLLACSLSVADAQPVSIIPQPVQVTQNKGNFTLTAQTVIGYEKGLQEQAEYLQDLLSRSTGWDLTVQEGTRKADIRLSLSPSQIKDSEGYRLETNPKGVTICGADEAGVFYGIQTLLQLFPSEVYSRERQRNVSWTVPAVSVYDAPERPWRGMMLDVARYFYDKDFVKKYIDMMAMYKLNKLQFHLIDDSGWRLEIKKYPLLTEIGAWAGPDSKRLGGYYTQEDIKEIIEYGRLRNVEIIPEIEFPAHMLSAVAAYPWLCCTGEQHEVPVQHFISRDLLCVGKESSYQFLKDVLDETVALFPSHYINIGGDEAVYTRWEECPRCQAVMKREGLTKASELQGYLTNVVSDMMKEKDRTVIGWEEIIQRGKVKNPVVALMWHNVGDSIQATRTGHKAILTPATHMYFDFAESKTPGEIKAAGWMPPISLEKCYSMEINDYSPTSTVIGVQGCLWSDQFIHGTVLQELPLLNENRSENYAEYLTFPRLLALSEVAWGKMADRNYADFQSRIRYHYAKLDHKSCHYRVPEPEITDMKENSNGETEITLKSNVEGARILYTTNGRYPSIHSAEYNGPVRVADKNDFHAITVVDNHHYSLPLYFAPDYSAYKEYGEFVYNWNPAGNPNLPSPLKIECTGKISGNGDYELSFIHTKGNEKLTIHSFSLLKRDEKLAGSKEEKQVGPQASVATYSFSVDQFEAGTPFFLQLEWSGENGTYPSGLIFIRKK